VIAICAVVCGADGWRRSRNSATAAGLVQGVPGPARRILACHVAVSGCPPAPCRSCRAGALVDAISRRRRPAGSDESSQRAGEGVGLQRARNTRTMPWLGMPPGRFRNAFEPGLLAVANYATSAQPSAPQTTAQIAITRMAVQLVDHVCARVGQVAEERRIPSFCLAVHGKLLNVEVELLKYANASRDR